MNKCRVSTKSLRRILFCDQTGKQNGCGPIIDTIMVIFFKNLIQRLLNIRIFVHKILLSVYCFHHWTRISVSLSDFISTISRLLLMLKFMRNEIESQFLLHRIIKWDWQLMNKFYKVSRYPNSVWAGLILKL